MHVHSESEIESKSVFNFTLSEIESKNVFAFIVKLKVNANVQIQP